MGFVGLNTAVSGLRAAQVGLAVTGHNITNSEIYGYSRQRVVQKDWAYSTIGTTAYGPLKRGLGTDWNAVQQIRNEYLDITFRNNASRLSFYSTKTLTGMEIESLLGELHGASNFQSVINNMWYAIQELTTHPQGIETRDFFLATCHEFVTKSNEVYNSLFEYQLNLDHQIRETVTKINDLVTRVKELNQIIAAGEASGDNANDFRDERNIVMDRLSELIPMDYYYDYEGKIGIFSNGVEILAGNQQSYFSLRLCTSDYPFVEPIIYHKPGALLPADTPPSEFTQWLSFTKPINAERDNDYGTLLGLIISRGAGPAFHMGVDGLKRPEPPAVPSPAEQAVWDRFRSVKTFGPKQYMPATVTDLVNLSGDAKALLLSHYWNVFDAYHGSPLSLLPPLPPGTEITAAVANAYFSVPANANSFFNAVQSHERFLRYNDDMRRYQAHIHNYNFQVWSIQNCMIPKTMIKLDQIVNNVVRMINDTLAPYIMDETDPDFGKKDPNAPFDNHVQRSYVEVFTRKNIPRWDASGNFNPEEPGNFHSFYSIGNIMINPKLLNTDGGYNYLALSDSGDVEDTNLLRRLQEIWQANSGPYAVQIGGNFYSVQNAYVNLVNALAVEVNEAKNYVSAQTVLVNQADNRRQSIMGVSLDEEMNNMMKYQFAYQSAARILNVIDSMIDTVVNRMGRAGM